MVDQAPSSFLLTVTKSCWIKTPVMWSTVNNFLARGDLLASASPFVKWKPELVSAPSLTGWLGRNLREKGLGVFSTCMKTDLAQRGAVLRRRVVAARMVLLCAFARAVKLQRCGSCTCPGAKLLRPEPCGGCGGAGESFEKPCLVLGRSVAYNSEQRAATLLARHS